MPVTQQLTKSIDFRRNYLCDFHLRQFPDPHVPDPLVRGMDPEPDPDPSVIKKNLDFYCFVTSFGLLSLKNDVNVPAKSDEKKNF
jgi:hypothetical protein